MKITVVYDNYPVEAGLSTGWGFSLLIDTEQGPLILFDTGDDGDALLHNMRHLNIDPCSIGEVA